MANRAQKKKTFSPDLFTSMLQLCFRLVKGKLTKKKCTFSPDFLIGIFQLFFILVNGKLAEKKLTLYYLRPKPALFMS